MDSTFQITYGENYQSTQVIDVLSFIIGIKIYRYPSKVSFQMQAQVKGRYLSFIHSYLIREAPYHRPHVIVQAFVDSNYMISSSQVIKSLNGQARVSH